MTERATFTRAELKRAQQAAEEIGRTVKILYGAMYLVDPEDVPDLTDKDSTDLVNWKR